MADEDNTWLASLRHDVLKRVLWVAHDLRDSGAMLCEEHRRLFRDALFSLTDDEGAPSTAQELWITFRERAPVSVSAETLDRVERWLDATVEAIERESMMTVMDTVLRLEAAFDELAQHMKAHRS